MLFPLPPLRREEAAAPLLSAAWKDVSRTLSPSGGPASTHEEEEEEEEVEGEEVDDERRQLKGKKASSPPLFPSKKNETSTRSLSLATDYHSTYLTHEGADIERALPGAEAATEGCLLLPLQIRLKGNTLRGKQKQINQLPGKLE